MQTTSAGARQHQRRWLAAGGVLGAIAIGAAALAYGLIARYVDPYHAQVAAAGYVARTAQVNGVEFSYVEGPDNGPPLVLLHAQHLDWFSYSRVLPALARSFHVYDVDYPGHGATTVPAGYPMTANRIGADLGDFIATTVKAPAFVTGNSSGGLLAVWLAANRSALVRAVLLEDPPLFSSEYPRIRQTIADKSFATSAQAVHDGTRDFLPYWITASTPFFDKHVFPGSAYLLRQAIKARRHAHPGEPVEIGLIPNDTVRMLLRGLDRYDPRFGAAFHDGSWNAGFDHAAALAHITCPALLLQATTSTTPDGLLEGAMSAQEAARARSLLRTGQFMRVDATHVVNLDQPTTFVRIAERFFLGR
jgi:pimeloyl-ACP methyl ester carboxylesterase